MLQLTMLSTERSKQKMRNKGIANETCADYQQLETPIFNKTLHSKESLNTSIFQGKCQFPIKQPTMSIYKCYLPIYINTPRKKILTTMFPYIIANRTSKINSEFS